MQIRSYVGIDEAGILFGTLPDVAQAALGAPLANWPLDAGGLELEYPGLLLRYSEGESGLEEMAVVPGGGRLWKLNDIPISWDESFLRGACLRDGVPMEYLGFVVLLELGVALSGFDPRDEGQLAVNVFRRGLWDKRKSKFVPYRAAPGAMM